jgi:hypothetical protein
MSDNKSKNQEYVGTVVSPFKTKKKRYEVDKTYKTKDKRSFDYLVETGRIKKA